MCWPLANEFAPTRDWVQPNIPDKCKNLWERACSRRGQPGQRKLQTCKRRSNRDRIALKSHHFSALIAGGTPANISSLARNTESPVCNSLKQGFRV